MFWRELRAEFELVRGHTVVMMEALADILVDVRAIKALLEEDDEQDDAGGEG